MTIDDLGSFLREKRGELLDLPVQICEEADKDISIMADKLLHKEITGFLGSVSDHPVLSEEAEAPTDFRDFTGFYWIVDPLDGSLNFSRTIPISCVSLALWKGGSPVAGVIYDFNRDEMFTGVVEISEESPRLGAWLNDKEIRVSDVMDKSRGVVSTGFPSYRDYGTESISGFVKKVQEWKKVRMIGSAALSLAWVASGRVDAYMEEDVRIWDVAAGLALVKAAGGEIYFKAAERQNFLTVAATNGKIPAGELL